jgi:hypothetical protein
MSIIKIKRGLDTNLPIGSEGEPLFTTDTHRLFIGDGTVNHEFQKLIDPKALSVSNDINLTLSLGGTPGTALLQPVSLALGWTGTLADSRIASAATWNAKIGGSGIANELAYFSGTNTISSLSTSIYPSLTELSYVKGVTSSIQTQLNSKQNTLTNPVTGTGVNGQVTFWTGTNTQSGSNNLIWNNTTGSLSINTTQSLNPLEVSTSVADMGIRLSSNTNPRFTLTRAGIDRLMLTATGNIGVISSSPTGLALQGGTTDAIRIFGTTHNVLLGSSGVDSGFRLDVNGTARINTGFEVQNAGIKVNSNAGGFGGISISGSAPVANNFTFGNILLLSGSGTTGNNDMIRFGGNLTPTASGTYAVSAFLGNPTASSGTANMVGIHINSTLNFTGTYSGIWRGLFYNPILTSLTGTTHRAIETVTGNVIFGSTSGNVGIGVVNPDTRLTISVPNDTAFINILNSSALNVSQFRASYVGFGVDFAATRSASGFFSFTTSGLVRTLITSDGNVLIGTTTNSGERLRVEGGSFRATGDVFLGGTTSTSPVTVSSSLTAVGIATAARSTHRFVVGNGGTMILSSGSSPVIDFENVAASPVNFRLMQRSFNSANWDIFTIRELATNINVFNVDGVNKNVYIHDDNQINGRSNSTAMLELASTTKVFLPPRMTTAQKNAISNPSEGSVIYDTTLRKLCIYTSTWETVTSI